MLSLRVSSDIDVTIDREYFSSYVQCKSLNVWSVYFYFKHTFLPRLFFPEGMGGVQNISVKFGGVGGGYFIGQKMEIPVRRGGLYEISSVVGVWIFSGTTH